MKEMQLSDLKDARGVWIIVDKNNEQLLVEDDPRGDKLTKLPYLLIFNDYKKANYFLYKSGVAGTNPNWVILNIPNQDIWSKIQGRCDELDIDCGRLNTCVEKGHNCAKLIVTLNDYKNFDSLRKAVLKQDYDHWDINNRKDSKSKTYIWDWEHIESK